MQTRIYVLLQKYRRTTVPAMVYYSSTTIMIHQYFTAEQKSNTVLMQQPSIRVPKHITVGQK